jgi:Lrp/AsnC family transcriptional regulator for asnA, asnC and gidA
MFRGYFQLGGTMLSSIDDTDRAIIALLNEDGRMKSAEIARRLGDVPSRTVSYRIDSLIERGIISIKALVNPPALGYNVLADVLLEVEPGRVRAVAETAAAFPQVSYVACATGESDVSISVRVRDNEELFNFVTDQISKIPGVRRTQTHLLPVMLKDIDTWLPPELIPLETEAETS